jgi:putative DNA primase/helicase
MKAADIARALGGKRSGNQWKCRCPAHSDKDPSMIVFDGRQAVQVRCFSGCEPIDIIAALRSMGLWGDGEDAGDLVLRPRLDSAKVDPNRHQDLALQIWERSVYPRGTLAEQYLGDRGLLLPESAAGGVIRYCADCPQGNFKAPALVALMRNIETYKPQAIQRLFLVKHHGRIVKSEAMMLGPVGQAAMMVTSPNQAFWQAPPPYCPRLCVCEGLETALALHQAVPGCRYVWALGSAGAIARFPVLAGVGQLVIFADNDKNEVGLRAAIECSDRWNASPPQSAKIKMPAHVDTDFADELAGETINGTAA